MGEETINGTCVINGKWFTQDFAEDTDAINWLVRNMGWSYGRARRSVFEGNGHRIVREIRDGNKKTP